MKTQSKTISSVFAVVIIGCGEHTSAPPQAVFDIDANGIPRFVVADYVELTKVDKVSRFRSGVGHDYSGLYGEDPESCRSKKHYYVAFHGQLPTMISPVTGTLERIIDEGDLQLLIIPDGFPAFTVKIFHVTPAQPFSAGDRVTAGQRLGTGRHQGDIAVSVNTPSGSRLISYFEVMQDHVFQSYVARGVTDRNALIISKQDRDSHPLTCNGEEFNPREQATGTGQSVSGGLENWVILSR